MSCCGQGRAKEMTEALEQARMAAIVPNRRPVYGAVAFEYTGHTSLTVTGPATGAKYRFDTPGSRVQVAGMDSVAMAAIRVLRRV